MEGKLKCIKIQLDSYKRQYEECLQDIRQFGQDLSEVKSTFAVNAALQKLHHSQTTLTELNAKITDLEKVISLLES